ncbi:hypothetical protein C1646_776135 [Rhizophagus diaphanus]|nr:hypothetical protein C1646_776135 [Rhizophagus diaphanus] [Rhizophagus sp. MUCL 43196]
MIEKCIARALGFTTPLLHHIDVTNIKEITVDSTFKTNQKQFELFVVNANCGGYEMPIAYLYLLICDGMVEAYNDPKNQVNTRVQVLHKFFANLRNEKLLPSFVLVDKDARQISAIEKAWIKNQRYLVIQKTRQIEAHQQFNFIEPSWIPSNCTGSLCPDEKIKEIINIIKKHAVMHPLIPVAKNTFWNSAQIYQYCVQVYQFCHDYNLSKLWGYLWVNWYNKKDWKLFACSAYSSVIPLARTTMITESHWRVLKYNYKYNYNQPRLDHLTQILVEQLVPDSDIKLTQYYTNHCFSAWWQTFKRDWNKAANTKIEPGMDERYHIDEVNWICSCPAYFHNPYFLCKHLVAKKNILPTFMETIRRHDYPLVFFSSEKVASICQENDPWKRYDDFTERSYPNSGNLHNTELEKIDSMKLVYEKVFDSALKLYEREKDNTHFVASFDALMKPIVKAIEECDKKLSARTQQNTWGSKNGKLAFWLR